MSPAVIDDASPPTSAALPAELSARFPNATPIGHGRAGSAWLAQDHASARDVVLKLARPDADSAHVEARRCRHEADLLSRLEHPRVLAVLDSGELHDGSHWWISPRAAGGTVGSLLDASAAHDEPIVPLERVLALLGGIAEALDHAHALGVVHGALTPEQVLLDEHGDPLVCGFQVDLLDPCPDRMAELVAPAHYRAPERRDEGLVGAPSDQYALALIAYELLRGERRAGAALGTSVEAVDVPDLSAGRLLRPGMRREPSDVIQRALLRDPAWRFASAGEFVQALVAAVAKAEEEEAAAARRRVDDEERERAAERARRRIQGAGLVIALAALGGIRASASLRERIAIDRAVAESKAQRAAAEPPPEQAPAPERAISETAAAVQRALEAPPQAAAPQRAPQQQAATTDRDDARETSPAEVPNDRPPAAGGASTTGPSLATAQRTAAAFAASVPNARAAGAARPAPVAPGVVIVAGATRAVDADVAIDGVSRGAAPLLLRIPAGTHRLTTTARRLAVAPLDTTIVVNAGQTTTVVLRISRGGARTTRPAAPTVTPAPSPSGRAPRT
jgi:eukaryotic-like serine/threonine-protein kinase